MIPHDVLVKIVNKMVAETGQRGIQTMCPAVGINWDDLCATVTANFGKPDGRDHHPSQLAMDFLMLGAAIGYMYAKGDSATRDVVCPHCDGTGVEPSETSCYPPEPCSICKGNSKIN